MSDRVRHPAPGIPQVNPGAVQERFNRSLDSFKV